MKKILYVVLSLICLGLVSCSTEDTSLEIIKPYDKPKQYYDDLRTYKKTDHEIFFGWFGGWSASSTTMGNTLESVPDSVDVISIWGKHTDLPSEQIKDLRRVQELKGTKVTFTIFAHNLPSMFEETEEGIKAYAKSHIDTMNMYGYDGIDLDYEPGYNEAPGVPFSGALVGPESMFPNYKNNMEIFVRELAKYIGPKSGTDKLLIIDGVPYHLNLGLAELFSYGVVQSYSSKGYTDLQNRFNKAADNGWKPEQYVFTETFEGTRGMNGGVDHELRDGTIVPSLEGMARFKPEYNGSLVTRKGGCGTYHMETDYSNPKHYKYTREAISLMSIGEKQ